ncbi:MAG: glycosyltransferase family 4 protein [Acidobacteriota bacterium]|nr:glycosyltransferase family 4 protein [Acidobacteriota bacterium]
MRVGFDARALVSPAAGVRRYARELFAAMAKLDGVDVVAAGTSARADLPAGVTAAAASASLPTNLGWMISGLPRAARSARLDVFHAPSYTAPFAGPRPLVLTIHDISYERHPEWYPYRRDPVRRAFYRWSARTADRIITDSQFSKQEIVAGYSLDPECISVVPLAAGVAFTPADSLPAMSSPYVLHVGDLHPRRNLAVAVRALKRVRARRTDLRGLRLVLAGVDRGSGAALVQNSSPEDSQMIELAGKISDDALVQLYRGASGLVYPSLYEGFGLPLLEAMACGTPVIASRASSIPEVTGEAAVLLDPNDDAGWAEAIESLFDPEVARPLSAAGLRRADTFTWNRAAAATVDVYRQALSARR